MFELRPLLATLALASGSLALAQGEVVRDPTRPFAAAAMAAGEAVQAAPDFKLTAVLVSPSRRIAVINGEFLKEGDRVNGRLISTIEPGLVRLGTGEGQLVLRVSEQQVVTDDGEVSQ